ncbi:hypothetical protein EIP91_007963 [Steccherinum ochraceum]|uniref:Enoyl reductase (ER) domain-containing protein n=1 Tax=Steccherinum ochraceum TaxID=92696 RepID=A0A4R0R3H7_9APHY|nr:hypothetical protein EIP91_007963 [Steccherinum ochraceum]
MSLPSTQQTLAITTAQGAWEVYPYPVHEPQPDEVAIKIEAVGLNPVDWKVQAIRYFSNFVKEYPAILGSDAAGVVVAVGEGVADFAVGDRVLYQGYFTNRLSTFKQYSVFPSELVAKIPDTITFDQAATVPLALATAALGLYNAGNGVGLVAPWKEGGRGKYAGQPLVLLGGSTSVGQFVLQLAKISGLSPIIATASPRNFDLVKAFGATHVIDRKLSASEIAAAVKDVTSDPVKIVYDAISLEHTQLLAYSVLSLGGTLVLLLPSLIPEDRLIADSDSKKVVIPFGNFYLENNRELGKSLYAVLRELLETGEIKASPFLRALPNPVEVLPEGLVGIVDGLARLQADKVSARKLVARPHETK